ncbi:hypothetical protein [Desulfopila aestuarii]|nr:hypothetical protein [Desulfopila aestuarii]
MNKSYKAGAFTVGDRHHDVVVMMVWRGEDPAVDDQGKVLAMEAVG